MKRSSFLKNIFGVIVGMPIIRSSTTEQQKVNGRYLHHWDNCNGRFVAYKEIGSNKTKIAQYENMELISSSNNINKYKLVKVFG